MNATQSLLLEELDNAFDKRSWHGANLLSALRGVSPGEAARSVGGRKSIWQQLLHAAYWKHRALTYLGDTMAFPRKGSNWLKPPSPVTKAVWNADIEMLVVLQRRLRKLIRTMPPKKFNRKVRWLLHGAAAHDLYHAGQIKLLRRLL